MGKIKVDTIFIFIKSTNQHQLFSTSEQEQLFLALRMYFILLPFLSVLEYLP